MGEMIAQAAERRLGRAAERRRPGESERQYYAYQASRSPHQANYGFFDVDHGEMGFIGAMGPKPEDIREHR